MVGADVRDQVGEGTDPGQDALGVVGVQPDRLGERGCSAPAAGRICVVACLLEQAVRHGDLAEVVDQPGPAQALPFGCREPVRPTRVARAQVRRGAERAAVMSR